MLRHPIPCALLLPALLWGAVTASAATVTVVVADPAGAPLDGPVVMLEPVAGGVAVKPMSGVQVAQAHRQFDPQVTVITVGTAVTFPNFDTVRHHVYSFSPAKTFELRLYAGVPNVPVVFDKPGVAVLGCNIHDQMAAWLVVVDTPYHGRGDARGRVQLAHVPAGAYRVRVWHPSLGAATEAPTLPLTVGDGDVDRRLVLAPQGTLK